MSPFFRVLLLMCLSLLICACDRNTVEVTGAKDATPAYGDAIVEGTNR
jgi:hypothetical protein